MSDFEQKNIFYKIFLQNIIDHLSKKTNYKINSKHFFEELSQIQNKMSSFSRSNRSVSQQTYTSKQPVINIQSPIIKDDFSQEQSSLIKQQKQLSIHDKINILNSSIRTSQKNQKYFQQTLVLRQKLHQTEELLQDANIKCSLWDKLKQTLQLLNKDYLHLKSIDNNCSDGTILKQFLTVLKQKLQKITTSLRLQKSYSVQSKRKDTQYYQLYENEKKQRYEYQQHIITLNNELDSLQEQNEKLKQKVKTYQSGSPNVSSLHQSISSSGLNDSKTRVVDLPTDQQLQAMSEQIMQLRQQNNYIFQHNKTLIEQLQEQRARVKEIEESLDKYENQLKERENDLKKKIKELQQEVYIEKDIQKTLKIQLQQQILQNQRLNQTIQGLRTTPSFSAHQKRQAKGVLQSQEYKNLLTEKQHLYQKFKNVLHENQSLGQQRQTLGQQLQQIQRLSKQMQYNYEVKIDDIRKVNVAEMAQVALAYNNKSKQLLDQLRLAQTKQKIEQQNILLYQEQIFQLKMQLDRQKLQSGLRVVNHQDMKELAENNRLKLKEIEELQKVIGELRNELIATKNLSEQQQNMVVTIQSLKRALYQQQANNDILRSNVMQWQKKYNKMMQQKVKYMQNVKSEQEIKMQEISGQNGKDEKGNDDNQQSQLSQIIKQLKSQLQQFQQENTSLRMKHSKDCEELASAQQQIQQIQRYLVAITLQNKKIILLEEDLEKIKEENKKLKQKIKIQKEKFMEIISKNQSIYQQVIAKSIQNQNLFKSNIQVQLQSTRKLQLLVDRYSIKSPIK